MSYLTETYDQSDRIVFEFTQDGQLPFVKRNLGKTAKQNIYYSDVNSRFKLDDQALIVYDSRAINRQIDNILSTPLGSDDFEPEFGSMLPFRLFDPITPMVSFLLRSDTIDAVGRWLGSKITMDTLNSSVDILNDDPDYEGYLVNMRYMVNKTRAIATYSMAFVR